MAIFRAAEGLIFLGWLGNHDVYGMGRMTKRRTHSHAAVRLVGSSAGLKAFPDAAIDLPADAGLVWVLRLRHLPVGAGLARQNVCVDATPGDEARAALADAIRMWRLEPITAGTVIDAAVGCLVAGLDTPSLCELAGAPPRTDVFSMEQLILDTLRQLDMQALMEEDIKRGALVAMLHRLEAGQIEARELARWAHRHIGYQGDRACQVFVELDDMYDTLDVGNYSEADLARWALDETDAFLSGRPSPGHTDVWRDPGRLPR